MAVTREAVTSGAVTPANSNANESGSASAARDAMSPLVSIVTPSFNSAAYIERTIQSIHGQGYPRIEHVVMDGGSTDGTQEIIAKHREKFAHVESGPDSGMYDAIDRGFRHTTGEIMTWLNSDDEWFPGTLKTVVRIFREFPDVEWITSGFPSAIDAEGATIATSRHYGFTRLASRQGEYLSDCEWYSNGFIQQESTFWRRSLWERAGSRLDTSLKLAGDYELWSRFFDHAPLWQVEVPLGAFRRRAGQLSQVSHDRYIEEARRVFERDGGRAPSKWSSGLRVGFRRHAPTKLRQLAFRLGFAHPRSFIGYHWHEDRWMKWTC